MSDIFANNATLATTSTSGTTTPTSGTSESWSVSALSAAWPSLTAGQTMSIQDPAAQSEIIRITASTGSGATSITVTRGADSTTPVAHATGATFACAAVASALNPSPYVQRSGTQLVLNGEPFVFTGFNFANFGTDGPGWASLATIAASGSNVVRAWWFQTQSVVSGAINFTTMDGFVAAATANGIKLIITLTNAGDEACNLAWYQGAYASAIASGHVVTYQSWVQQVVARYANNPTVMMWQLANEGQASTDGTGETTAFNAMLAFANAMGAIVKGLAPNQLLNLGNILGFNGGGHQWGGSSQSDLPPYPPTVGRDDYQLLLSCPYLDVGDYHDYGYPHSPLGRPNPTLSIQGALTIGAAVGKPIMVGETGIDWLNESTFNPPISPNTLAARAPLFQAKFVGQLAAGVVGVLIWSWRDSPGSGDGPNYGLEVGVGDPVLAYMPPSQYQQALPAASSLAQPVNSVGIYVATGAAQTLLPNTVNRYLLNVNCTFTLPAAVAGTWFMAAFVQPASGGPYVPTITGANYLTKGTPIWSTAANAKDVVMAMCFDTSTWVVWQVGAP
jgi:mannan endo-1,4-beta-mannosidase